MGLWDDFINSDWSGDAKDFARDERNKQAADAAYAKRPQEKIGWDGQTHWSADDHAESSVAGHVARQRGSTGGAGAD